MIEQVGAAERIRPRPENGRSPDSRLSGTVFLALFIFGIAEGAVGYLRRSPVMERHVAGTNATVNAWGGPSYLGALLAHWLDGIVGFYAAAFLLSHVLSRTEGELR